MSSPDTTARNTSQIHTGTWKLAKFPSDDDDSDANTAIEESTDYLRLCHMDFQPKVSPASKAVVTGLGGDVRRRAVMTIPTLRATPLRSAPP
jgi:hypothetical protein